MRILGTQNGLARRSMAGARKYYCIIVDMKMIMVLWFHCRDLRLLHLHAGLLID
jgi:hypothetical protein